MKTSLFITAASMILSIHCIAQNKTLGVGTATPNANAALHIESPTSNQGFIMPRLTTAQRTAMVSLPLTSADDGLLVYDKDLKKIYLWDGSSWQLTGTGGGMTLPFRDSVTSSAIAFEITNTGAGGAGNFLITDTANTSPALNIYHNGSSGIAINANKPIVAPSFYSSNNSATDGTAGNFRINDAGNSATALESSTTGAGIAFVATTTGGSHAGLFQVNNSGNTSNVLHATTDGLGSTGYFANTNSSNTLATVGVDTNGSGFAVGAFTTGTGSAGHFQNNNPANTLPALVATSNGAAPALAVDQTNNGVALQINNGTLKYSIFTVPAGGDTIVTQRAGIYVIQDTRSYSFGFGEEGETILVQPAGGSANIEGIVINGSEIRQLIFVGGVWRIVGYCYTC